MSRKPSGHDQRSWAAAVNPKTGFKNWEEEDATGDHGYYDPKKAKTLYLKDIKEHEHPYWGKKK